MLSVTYLLNPMTWRLCSFYSGKPIPQKQEAIEFTERYEGRTERNAAMSYWRRVGYDYVPALMGYGEAPSPSAPDVQQPDTQT